MQEDYVAYLMGMKEFGNTLKTLYHFLAESELLHSNMMLWIDGRPIPKSVGLRILRKIPMYELSY